MTADTDYVLKKLPNGLTIIASPRPGSHKVSLGIWVGCGSRHEDERVNGISHFIEHMLFKGTKNYSRAEILGNTRGKGGHINAATSLAHTYYYATVFPQDFAKAFDIISDMVMFPAFDAKELETERKVVLEEIRRSEDKQDRILSRQLMQAAYPGQPFSRRVLGDVGVIETVTRDDMFAYHGKHYTAGNMVVAVVGDVTPEEVEALVSARMGGMPDVPATDFQPAVYAGGDARLSRKQSQLAIDFCFPGPLKDDDDLPAAVVLSHILGGGMTSRLFENVREKHGLVYGIHASCWATEDTGLFSIEAATGPGNAEKMMPIICRELLRATRDITAEEVAETIASVKMGLLESLEKASGRCDAIGRQALRHGIPKSHDEILAKYGKVTPEDVKRVAKKIFSGKPTLAALGPLEGLPSYDDILEMMQGREPAPKPKLPAPQPRPFLPDHLL